jgi:hypothetical protein
VPAARPPAERPDTDLRATSVFLLPTHIVPEPGAATELRERADTRDAAAGYAGRLDAILSDGVQDLGLTIDVSEKVPATDRSYAEIELVELGTRLKEWIVSPTIEKKGGAVIVRLAAVPPGSKIALVRSEKVELSQLALRGVVMLRDLITGRPAADAATPREPPDRSAQKLAVPTRSPGRATLALNAALFGAMIGYSIERASNSDDPRILYPLMALGTGFGLGVSTIIAEEWDVGLGDAWYLSAGAWWPAFGSYFLARGQTSTGAPEQYGAALIGAGAGLGLATTSLVLGGGMSEGGALFAHSGGAFGTFLGAMTDYAIRGTTDGVPYRGLGYGALIGVVVGGVVAPYLRMEPSQVLVIDLGAGLGALAGAAATSPFIFKSTSPKNERVFLLSTMGATVTGGVVAWLVTRKSGAPSASSIPLVPYAGIVPSASAQPCVQVGAVGRF